MTNLERHLFFGPLTQSVCLIIVCLDSPHLEQHPHMCRSLWIQVFTELCHYDQKLTTYHAHITHITHITQNKCMISVSFPPPHLCIILVGFIETNNGCRCDFHPDGCRNSMVIERADNRVGLELHLRMKIMSWLAMWSSLMAQMVVALPLRRRSMQQMRMGQGWMEQLCRLFMCFNPTIQTEHWDVSITTIKATLLGKLFHTMRQPTIIKWL